MITAAMMCDASMLPVPRQTDRSGVETPVINRCHSLLSVNSTVNDMVASSIYRTNRLNLYGLIASETLFDIPINNSLKAAILLGCFNDRVDLWKQCQNKAIGGSGPDAPTL